MDRDLSKILEGLLKAVPSRTESAAMENMHVVALQKGSDPHVVVRFLERAAEILLAQAKTAKIGLATFYAWYDDQAGQLRFSLVPGRPDALPFRTPFDHVTASDLVRDALSTWTPGFVPFEQLTGVVWTEPTASENRIRVWARTTEDAV
ncbi:MAG TPA: hypothetical protein VIF57_17345 [Polyangia bacterium]